MIPLSAAKYFAITETKQKTSEILDECKKLFNVWSYDDDGNLDKDFPPPKKITTRYFKKTIEADEENANKSANDLKDIPCITLRERLLMELQYFKETGEHLDIYNWTLCAGSRDAGGCVPDVDWSSGARGLNVGWCRVGGWRSHLRARAAVIPSDLILNPLGSDLETRVKAIEEVLKHFNLNLP